MKADIDAAIGRVLTTLDPVRRQEIYRDFLTTIHTQAVYLSISYTTGVVVHGTVLSDVSYGPTRNEIPFEAMIKQMDISLLIAGEPTTDLDVVSQSRILDLLDRLRTSHGMAILLVTHDLSVMARLTDHVAVMKNGAVVERGPVEHIFKAGRHPYTQGLLKTHLSLYGSRLERFQAANCRNLQVPTAMEN